MQDFRRHNRKPTVMKTLTAVLLGSAVLFGGAGAVSATGDFTQDRADQLTTSAHMQLATSDVLNCRTDLTADFNFTGGHRTRAVAVAEVAACQVSPGTTLSIRVLPGGYDYVLSGVSIDVPGYAAVSDTTAGGGVVVTKTAS